MTCCQPNIFSYFVGDTKTLSLKAIYSGSYSPLDLTDCTEIVVSLPNSDGSITQLKYSLSQVIITSPPVLGQFTVPLSLTLYPIPNIGELQSFFVTFTILGNTETIEYKNSLSVFEV